MIRRIAETAPETRLLVRVFLNTRIGEENGEYNTEAKLFFDKYGQGGERLTLCNGKTVWYQKDTGVLFGVTGPGKVSAATYFTAVLGDPRFDFSRALIVSAGCGGSATGASVMGDVILETAVVDYDLVYETLSVDEQGAPVYSCTTDPLFEEMTNVTFSKTLTDSAYELLRNVPIYTTEKTRAMLRSCFPGEAWADREPAVLRGTSVTSDTYWKGNAAHNRAEALTRLHRCADPFRMCEMEDVACALAARMFGLEQRMLVLRVSVNMDEYIGDSSEEDLRLGEESYTDRVSSDNAETADLFDVAMQNLFRCGERLTDAVLSGSFAPVFTA